MRREKRPGNPGEPSWTAGMTRMNRGENMWLPRCERCIYKELGKNHFLKWENCVYDVDM
jgi:hypothetical protein